MIIWDYPRNWENYFVKDAFPHNFTYVEIPTTNTKSSDDDNYEKNPWKNLSDDFDEIISDSLKFDNGETDKLVSYDLWCITQDNPKGFRVSNCYYVKGEWEYEFMGEIKTLNKFVVPTHYVKSIEGLN